MQIIQEGKLDSSSPSLQSGDKFVRRSTINSILHAVCSDNNGIVSLGIGCLNRSFKKDLDSQFDDGLMFGVPGVLGNFEDFNFILAYQLAFHSEPIGSYYHRQQHLGTSQT